MSEEGGMKDEGVPWCRDVLPHNTREQHGWRCLVLEVAGERVPRVRF